MTITGLRPTLGLYGDQYEEILQFMTCIDATVQGLARLCREAKADRAWHLLWMHPDNSLVHDSRSMSRLTLLLRNCYGSFPLAGQRWLGKAKNSSPYDPFVFRLVL